MVVVVVVVPSFFTQFRMLCQYSQQVEGVVPMGLTMRALMHRFRHPAWWEVEVLVQPVD